MYFFQQLIALVVAALFTSSLASPVQPLTRPFNCNDPKQGVNKNCWNELKVEEHLTDWVAHLPPRCKKDEAWSVCYDRVATTNLEQDCTQINSTKCQPFDPNFSYIHPQWYYGAYNTWSINNFFTSWYKAIDIIAKEYPAVIVNAAKPEDIDTFLAFKNNGQTSIDAALRGLIIKTDSEPQRDALMAAISEYPSTVKYDSNNIETADPPVATLLKTRLAQLLKYVESDLPAFLAMAAEGAFSQPKRLSEGAIIVKVSGMGGSLVGTEWNENA
ncbi:MAG: hypothetical protein Q9180_008236 [Flavoplaca navasiana]